MGGQRGNCVSRSPSKRWPVASETSCSTVLPIVPSCSSMQHEGLPAADYLLPIGLPPQIILDQRRRTLFAADHGRVEAAGLGPLGGEVQPRPAAAVIRQGWMQAGRLVEL